MQYAVFKIQGETIMKISNSQFSQNIALERNSIGQLIQVGEGCSIVNSVFSENIAQSLDGKSGQKGLEILSCDNLIIIDGCSFKDNVAISSCPNLNLIEAKNVYIQGSYFQNSKKQVTYKSLNGNFIALIQESHINVTDTTFDQGFGIQGGAINMQGSSGGIFTKVTFKNNKALKSGGVIFADYFDNLIFNDGCQFINNYAGSTIGDSINAYNSNGRVQINKSIFIANQAANFINSNQVQQLDIYQSSFNIQFVQKPQRLPGSGLTLTDVVKISITNSNFTELIGSAEKGGGGLLIQYTEVYVRSGDEEIKIQSSTFKSCQGVNGGAVVFINPAQVKLEGTFIGNMASKAGGAIYYSCISGARCQMTILDSEFFSNVARIEGGAIKWDFYEPQYLEDPSNMFANNTAFIYGDNIASVPKWMIRVNQSEFNSKNFTSINGTQQYHSLTQIQSLTYPQIIALQANGIQNEFETIRSGGQINVNLILIDKYGSIVSTDNSSKVLIRVQDDSVGKQYKPLIESLTQFVASKGIFQIQQLILVGTPNSTQSIIFETDAINMEIPDNSNEAKPENQLIMERTEIPVPIKMTGNPVFDIDFTLRSCIDGEELLPNGKCQTCPVGEYLLIAPNQPTLCQQCLQGSAECLGGNLIYPLPGFWRSSKNSDNMIPCRNDQACIGRNDSKENILGACQTGYDGILCSDCELGFSRVGTVFECQICPDYNSNVLRLSFILLIIIVVVVILVRANLQSEKERKNVLPVFLRILLNHFQLLTLTLSFDLEWPKQVQQFFSNLKPVSEVTTQFLSIDCLLDQRLSLTDKDNRIIYTKVVILAVLPILIVLLSSATWYMIKGLKHVLSFRKQFSTLKLRDESSIDQEYSEVGGSSKVDIPGRIISTIIIVLFLIHPTLTSSMFHMFNCEDIDGERRLYEDLEVECYIGKHFTMAYYLALPSLIVWGLGIPTFGLLLLIRNRKGLETQEVLSRYGFLYNGYRKSIARYWEFIIIYRKVVIIFIQVFLATQGKIVQALTTLVFLVLCIAATATHQPFTKKFLNNLETMSLLSSCITVYCGIYYIAASSFKEQSNFSLDDTSQTFFFAMIVLSHTVFGAYFVYHLFREIRSSMRTQFPKIYTVVYLCCKKRKLEQELRVISLIDKLRPFAANIDEVIEYMKDKRDMYAEGRIPIEDLDIKSIVGKGLQTIKRIKDGQRFSKKLKSSSTNLPELFKTELKSLNHPNSNEVTSSPKNHIVMNSMSKLKSQSIQAQKQSSIERGFIQKVSSYTPTFLSQEMVQSCQASQDDINIESISKQKTFSSSGFQSSKLQPRKFQMAKSQQKRKTENEVQNEFLLPDINIRYRQPEDIQRIEQPVLHSEMKEDQNSFASKDEHLTGCLDEFHQSIIEGASTAIEKSLQRRRNNELRTSQAQQPIKMVEKLDSQVRVIVKQKESGFFGRQSRHAQDKLRKSKQKILKGVRGSIKETRMSNGANNRNLNLSAAARLYDSEMGQVQMNGFMRSPKEVGSPIADSSHLQLKDFSQLILTDRGCDDEAVIQMDRREA